MCSGHLVISVMVRVGVLSGDWGMSCSKFVVWGILIITTTSGMLFDNVQHSSETSGPGSI